MPDIVLNRICDAKARTSVDGLRLVLGKSPTQKRTWVDVAVEYIKTMKLAAVNDDER
jgi:hypothetical protein